MFWTTLKWKVLGHGVPGFGTACFVLANFGFVERGMAAHAPLRPLATARLPARRRRRGPDQRPLACRRRLAPARAVGRPQRLRRHRPAVPSRRRLLRVLAAVLRAGCRAGCSTPRDGGGRHRRRLPGGRRAADHAPAGARARGARAPARARSACAARDGLAVPARPVRARAAAPRRDRARGRLHGRPRPPAGAAASCIVLSLAGAAAAACTRAVRRVPRRPLVALAVLGALALAAPGVVAARGRARRGRASGALRERPYLADASPRPGRRSTSTTSASGR